MPALRPIYIGKDEGVGSIVSRVERTGERNIALVVPPESALFRNVVEAEFLRDFLTKQAKEVVLVTTDAHQAEMAQGMGFKVQPSLETETQKEYLKTFYDPTKDQSGAPEVPPQPSVPSQPEAIPVTPAEPEQTPVEPTPEQPIPQQPTPPPQEPGAQMSDIVQPSAPQEHVTPEMTDDSVAQQPEPEEPSFPEAPSEEEQPEEEAIQPKKRKLFSFGRKKKKVEEDPQVEVHGIAQKKRPHKRLNVIFIGIILIALVVFIAAASFVFPRATVTIDAARDLVQLTVEASIDTNSTEVDTEQLILPGQVFEAEKTKTQGFPTSGSEERQEKARGTITVYNSFSSSPQTLIATTRFEAEDGKIFRTPEKVVIPGALIEGGKITPSSIDIEVVAEEAGEEYNIGPTTFTIPGFKSNQEKYEGFTAESKEAFSSGAIGTVAVMTQEDFDTAKELLESNILDEAQAELQSQIGNSLKIIEASIEAEILEVTTDVEVGTPAESFEMTVRARANAFGFTENELKSLIEEKIQGKISESKQLLSESVTLSYSTAVLDFELGTAQFSIDAQAEVMFAIDESQLKDALVGKDEVEARRALNLFPEVATARVRLWPFWIKKIPNDASKITITTQEE